MPTARIASATGAVDLYYEETGQGFPLTHAGLLILPMTGHTANIEEPALFNQHVAEFLTSVESGRRGTWKRSR